MINWNVTFNDDRTHLPVNAFLNEDWAAYTDQGPGQKMSIRNIITREVQLAGQQWTQYLKDPGGSVTVNVQILINSGIERTQTNNDTNGGLFGNTVATGEKDPKNNKEVAESFAAYKLRTGKAANGTGPDIKISINPDFWKNQLEHDLTTNRSEPDATPNRADAVSAFMHEIGHVLVASGFENNIQGNMYESPFDKATINATTLGLGGQYAQFAYRDRGTPVPLNGVDDRYHLWSSYHTPLYTVSATAGGGNTLSLASGTPGLTTATDITKGILRGMAVYGPNIPESTYVTAVNPGSVTLSTNVTGSGVPSGSLIQFDTTDTILRDSVLDGTFFRVDHHYQITSLDLGMLADSGFKIKAPLATGLAAEQSVHEGSSQPLSELLRAESLDPTTPIQFYVFRDLTANPNAGHFRVGNAYTTVNNNGKIQEVPVTGDRPAGEQTYVSASDLNKVSFVAGNTPGSNQLWFAAYADGMWSPPAHFTSETIV